MKTLKQALLVLLAAIGSILMVLLSMFIAVLPYVIAFCACLWVYTNWF